MAAFDVQPYTRWSQISDRSPFCGPSHRKWLRHAARNNFRSDANGRRTRRSSGYEPVLPKRRRTQWSNQRGKDEDAFLNTRKCRPVTVSSDARTKLWQWPENRAPRFSECSTSKGVSNVRQYSHEHGWIGCREKRR